MRKIALTGPFSNERDQLHWLYDRNQRRLKVAYIARDQVTGFALHRRDHLYSIFEFAMKIDLVTFQFERHGGGFVIEISNGNAGRRHPGTLIELFDGTRDTRRRECQYFYGTITN